MKRLLLPILVAYMAVYMHAESYCYDVEYLDSISFYEHYQHMGFDIDKECQFNDSFEGDDSLFIQTGDSLFLFKNYVYLSPHKKYPVMFGSWKKVLCTQDYIVVACQTIHDMNYYLLTLSTNHLDTLCGFPYNFGNYMLCVQWGASDRLQYIEVWKEDSIEKKYTLLMRLALDFYGLRNILYAYIYNDYVYTKFMTDNSHHYAKILIPHTATYAMCHKDRGIAAIRYNLLNLPDTIRFTNGNQIIHTYDAAGNRLRTAYYTRKVTTTVPLGNTLPVGTTANYYATHDIFHRNCVYHTRNATSTDYSIEFVHNPEGYIRYYTEEEHYHFYYIKDHLGSIRETYVHPSANYKQCIQRMQYYPSGLPWNTNYVANEQPYKYGGKEVCRDARIGRVRLTCPLVLSRPCSYHYYGPAQ